LKTWPRINRVKVVHNRIPSKNRRGGERTRREVKERRDGEERRHPHSIE